MSDRPEAKEPLDARSGNPSQNSRLRAATAIQSEVSPEDYPAAEREGQTAVVQAPAQALRKKPAAK